MPSHCVPQRQVPASTAFVTDSNRPQLLWRPPPTACLTASGAASEVPGSRRTSRGARAASPSQVPAPESGVPQSNMARMKAESRDLKDEDVEELTKEMLKFTTVPLNAAGLLDRVQGVEDLGQLDLLQRQVCVRTSTCRSWYLYQLSYWGE